MTDSGKDEEQLIGQIGELLVDSEHAQLLASRGLRLRIETDSGAPASEPQLNALIAALASANDSPGLNAGEAPGDTKAHSVAHEARNALAGVIGLAQQLGARFEGSEKQHRMLGLVESEARRCSRLLNNYLRGRRPEGRREAVALSSVAASVLVVLSAVLREQGITVHQRHHPAQPLVAAATPQIRQILINLVLNAIQAMEDGGELLVETLQRDGDSVVRVKDSGPGVPASLRERIFEHGFSTKEDRGSGFGLAVSAKIAAEHHGQLELIDEDGGACFELRLPPATG